MATTTPGVSAPASGSLKKPVLIVVGGIALYFAYRYTFHYFRWTEESYGYYWAFRLPLIFHVSGGLIALLVGVFQLWSGTNAQGMAAHPLSGRVYVAAVLLGSLASMILAVQSAAYGFAWVVGLRCLAAAWFATTAMALRCIRSRNIEAHRQWMTRSYIVTFAFVLFRISTDYLPAEAWWGIPADQMAVAMIWPVWVVPLLTYDLYLQHRGA